MITKNLRREIQRLQALVEELEKQVQKPKRKCSHWSDDVVFAAIRRGR